MLLCLILKYHIFWVKERRQNTIIALVFIYKYHIWETRKGHIKESLSFIVKTYKNCRMKVDQRT